MSQPAQPIGANDPPPRIRHIDDMDWETVRWPGETGKMLFHPRPENPTEPNAGLLKFAPGAHHPWHRHDFAQVWYVLEGQFTVGGKTYGPGTMFFHGDPHCEEELHTDSGGVMLIVQYPGPTTGGLPIYDDRFNKEARLAVNAERVDV